MMRFTAIYICISALMSANTLNAMYKKPYSRSFNTKMCVNNVDIEYITYKSQDEFEIYFLYKDSNQPGARFIVTRAHHNHGSCTYRAVDRQDFSDERSMTLPEQDAKRIFYLAQIKRRY